MAGPMTREKPAAIIAAEQQMETESLQRQLRDQDAMVEVGAFGQPIAGSVRKVEGTTIRTLSHAKDGHLLRGGTVTMWKPTTVGFRRRAVPEGNIRMNLQAGWRTTCPDCGGYCPDDPNLCPARGDEQYAECEVPNCNVDRGTPKRIYVRDLPSMASPDRPDDPNRINLGAKRQDPVSQLKSAMLQHVIRFHPSEAMAQGYITHVPERADVLLLDQGD